ncbi:MAG TPA: type II toxin-antitoxin system VapC family toxin [Thermoanaerobaculia bacterium]|nr:type II toxin-antitoxin system VapC family toxin [Thermoanaerobaculia bacterium]
MSLELVVDASVGIKLFVDEELSDRAAELFEGLAWEPPLHLYVPDLFYLECGNILWKYVRRFDYPTAQARESLSSLGALALQRLSDSLLVEESLDLALARGISVYDASYVTLAQHLDVPFVTADERLVRKLEGSGIEIRWLGEPGLLK